MKIKSLEIFIIIIDLIEAGGLCIFAAICLYNTKIDIDMLKAIGIALPMITILYIALNIKFRDLKPPLLNIFFTLLVLSGVVQNEKYEILNFLIMFCILCIVIKKILGKIISGFRFAERNKESLYHETGHYYMCKEFKEFTPIGINIYDEIKEFTKGEFIYKGNLEDLEPIQNIMNFLSGYVTVEYLLHNKKLYTLDELQRIILVETIGKEFMPEYKEKLIRLYLDENSLQEAAKNIMDIVEGNKEEIKTFVKKNQFNESICLRSNGKAIGTGYIKKAVDKQPN